MPKEQQYIYIPTPQSLLDVVPTDSQERTGQVIRALELRLPILLKGEHVSQEFQALSTALRSVVIRMAKREKASLVNRQSAPKFETVYVGYEFKDHRDTVHISGPVTGVPPSQQARDIVAMIQSPKLLDEAMQASNWEQFKGAFVIVDYVPRKENRRLRNFAQVHIITLPSQTDERTRDDIRAITIREKTKIGQLNALTQLGCAVTELEIPF